MYCLLYFGKKYAHIDIYLTLKPALVAHAVPLEAAEL